MCTCLALLNAAREFMPANFYQYFVAFCAPGGGKFVCCLCGVGNLNWSCHFFPAENTPSKGKSLCSGADGSGEKGYKKVMVTDLAFTKKLNIKSCTRVSHLNAISAQVL